MQGSSSSSQDEQVETADMLHTPLFTAEALLRDSEWSREVKTFTLPQILFRGLQKLKSQKKFGKNENLHRKIVFTMKTISDKFTMSGNAKYYL